MKSFGPAVALAGLALAGTIALASAAPRAPEAGRCAGTPLELARRDLEGQDNPVNTAEDIAATITFLEPEAPLYPCAQSLFAISPPDGSDSARLKFETRASQKQVIDFYRAALERHGRVEEELTKPVKTLFIDSGARFVAVHVHPPEDGLVPVFVEKEGKGGAGEAAARGAGDPGDAERPPGDLPPRLSVRTAGIPPGHRAIGPNPAAARECGKALIEIADVAPGILLSGVFSRVCRVETERAGTIGLYVQAENRDRAKPFPRPIAVNLACELPRAFEDCWKAREPWSRLDPPRNCISYENETARRAGLRAIGTCLVAKAGPPPDPAFARLRDAEAGAARGP